MFGNTLDSEGTRCNSIGPPSISRLDLAMRPAQFIMNGVARCCRHALFYCSREWGVQGDLCLVGVAEVYAGKRQKL